MANKKDIISGEPVMLLFYSSLFWLVFFPLTGVIVSLKFNYPDLFSAYPWLSFGRIRPIHVNGVIFGSFTTSVLCLSFYFVPKLCGVGLYKENLAKFTVYLWDITLAAGMVSLGMGENQGIEAGEFPLYIDIAVLACFLLFNIHLLGTIVNRKEEKLYVSLWYIIAAFVWTDLNYVLGNLIIPYFIPGINNAILHGLYIHYVVGLWITPMGLAVVYYFLPVSIKNPLYSHKLSLIGFWSIAFFYPLTGTHHYLFSPIPEWNETVAIMTSMMLIIPVWTVIQNFFGTMMGRWKDFSGDNFTVKFLVAGSFSYLLGCFQGSTQALRSVQKLTHFTDYVIGHSHLTVLATFILFCIGGLYYIAPKISQRRLYSKRLGHWHYWLTISGIAVMVLTLTISGLMQGVMWVSAVEFVNSFIPLKPFWFIRTLSGAAIVIGMILFSINMVMTVCYGEPYEAVYDTKRHFGGDGILSLQVKRAKKQHLEKPPAIVLVAGIGFFSMALFLMAAIPWLEPSSHSSAVKDSKGDIYTITPYTEIELLGRAVYIREGCFYCHSQYVRPVSYDKERFGPVSQMGEYNYDQPQLLGTRRIGPDLSRIGGKYGDDWHIAHFWAPRDIVPDSIMPSFRWLFEKEDASSVPVPKKELIALIAYLQRLGTQIGPWRSNIIGITMGSSMPATGQSISRGRHIFQKRCAGCHGKQGDGKGPASRFLHPKPRNLRQGVFKFKSTPYDSLPTDGDLYRIITRGIRGTAMPSWRMLSEYDRWSAVHYIKTLSQRFSVEAKGVPIPVRYTKKKKNSILKGKELFLTYCMICHGEEGKGDGPMHDSLTDSLDEPIRPANLSKPETWKGGAAPWYVYQRLMAGIPGTPMPSFYDVLTEEQGWDIVHFVMSLSSDNP